MTDDNCLSPNLYEVISFRERDDNCDSPIISFLERDDNCQS